MRRSPVLVASLIVIGAGAVVAGVPRLVRSRGWAPLVQLAGAGDHAAAIDGLTAGLQTLRCVLHGLTVDEPTREFVDELRDSLGDMDLEGLHELLPLSEGEWKRVRVVGRREGQGYAVRLAPRAAALDPTRGLGARTGDLLAQAATRPIATVDGSTNYVTQLELGLGVGAVSWDRITSCVAEAARLAASGDPRCGARDMAVRPDTATRLKVVETHPALRPEDVEVLAVLWESFPRLAEVLIEVARVDDVCVFDVAGAGDYQQLRLSGRLRPDLMEERYEELAEFLADLGPLLDARVRWVDAQGRQLARLNLQTGTLGLTLEAFVRDGRLLPVGLDGRVVLDEPAAPTTAPAVVNAVADLHFNLNGITTEVRGLEVDGTYAQGDGGAVLTARVSRVPTVAVGGTAFGILPSWAIDVMIPGNIGELTTELLTVLCKGDGGRGATFSLRARQAMTETGRDGPSTLELSGQLEVLNSLLIRLGFQIANQKLLPDEDVRAEVWDLFTRAHGALEQDLASFAQVMKK